MAMILLLWLHKPFLIANIMVGCSIPPGIDSTLSLQYYASGGNENSEWAPYTHVKHYTNAFIVCEGQVSAETEYAILGVVDFLLTDRLRLNLSAGPFRLQKTRFWGGKVCLLLSTYLPWILIYFPGTTGSVRMDPEFEATPCLNHPPVFLLKQGGKVEPGETSLQAAGRELKVRAPYQFICNATLFIPHFGSFSLGRIRCDSYPRTRR